MAEGKIKLSAEDRLDILELFANYAWGIDLAEPELVVQCFAEDGYFDHLWQGRVQGHAAIIKNLEDLWYKRQSWWYGRQHLFNHFRFDAESQTRCRVRSFFQILQFNVDYGNNFVMGIGSRDDVVEKIDGQWLFKSLFVNAWTSADQVPWKGKITMPERPRHVAAPQVDLDRK
jgi:hypothetical protein